MNAEHWAWLGAGILSVLSCIVLVGNAADRIKKFWKALRAPTDDIRKDVDELKEWRKETDIRLSKTDTTVRAFDGAYHVLFQTLLALLDHGIDGNNITQMEAAKKAVQEYLIDK